MRQGVTVAIVVGLVYGGLGTAASAQRNERRGKWVEDVLRVLVETQVMPHVTHDREPPPPQPGGPSHHGRPGHRNDPHHREDWRLVQGFAAEAGELVSILRRDEYARPEIRPLLGDAIAVKALSDALVRRAEYQPDSAVFREAFPAVTQRWRSLSMQLERSFAVSATCRECTRKLDALDREICKTLGINPTFDRETAGQLMAAMSGHLRILREVIAVDRRHSGDAHTLMLKGRQLEFETNALAATLGYTTRYDDVAHQYQRLFQSWQSFAELVRLADYQGTDHHLRRIGHLHRQMHELLWMPLELDRRALAHAAEGLHQRLQMLCELISLKTLLAMPDGVAVLRASHELQTMCADFARSAAGTDSLDSLQWDFRPLNVQWLQYRDYFRDGSSPELSLRLAEMNETIQSLQELLGIAPLLDLERAIELAGQVDSLADLLRRDVKTRVRLSSRYTPQFRRDIDTAAEAVHKLAHELNEDLVRQPQAESLRQRSEALAIAWQELQVYIGKLEPTDRTIVTRNYERLAPSMARLQMMFL